MAHKEVLPTPSLAAGKGVWTFYAEITIAASARKVYDAARDFKSYPEWNAYTPNIRTASGSNDIAVGDKITLAYRPQPVGKLKDIPCKITTVDDDEMTFSWQGQATPAFVLFPEKVHQVIATDDNECIFRLYETQAGPMAHVVKWTMAKALSEMAQGTLEGLKAYVESRQAHQLL